MHTILKQRKKPDDKNVDIINSKKRKGEDFVIGLLELVPFTSVNTITSDGCKISDSKKLEAKSTA